MWIAVESRGGGWVENMTIYVVLNYWLDLCNVNVSD